MTETYYIVYRLVSLTEVTLFVKNNRNDIGYTI